MQMMQDVIKSMELEKYLNYTQSYQQMLYLAELNMLTLHTGPCCLATYTTNKTDHSQSFFNL